MHTFLCSYHRGVQPTWREGRVTSYFAPNPDIGGHWFRVWRAVRCGPTFRLARTHPTHARSSGLETSLRSPSLADYTIDTHESEFSEATPGIAGNFRPTPRSLQA